MAALVLAAPAIRGGLKLYRNFQPGMKEAAEKFERRDMVFDEAGLMAPEQADYVAQYHKFLLDDYDIDYRVVTLGGVRKSYTESDINYVTHQQFKELEAGSKSKTGRALLLVIDVTGNLVRMETSAALEGVYTDAFVAYIQQNQMVHFFRTNRVADGILATTEMIYTRAQEAAEGLEFDPRQLKAFSTGGGAKTGALLGAGPAEKSTTPLGVVDVSGATPKDIVKAYLDAMAQRNSNPGLPIYTQATRQMLAGWTVTPAQMDNIVRAYQKCSPPQEFIDGQYGLSVLRYPAAERQCNPWFLTLENGEWKLDLTMMQTAIRFNHRNEWHFSNGWPGPYAFAFQDWRFDSHGFPHE